MWCSSAVNFFPSCRCAASRTRSNSRDTSLRLWVRSVFRCPELLLVGLLPSIASFWFGDFSGTTSPSDFSRSFISASRPWPSLRGSSALHPRATVRSPGSRARSFVCMPRSSTAPVPPRTRAIALVGFAFRSAPDGVGDRYLGVFSRLYHAACSPLSTLDLSPHGVRSMTRGQVGSLLLSLSNISVVLLTGLPALRAGRPHSAYNPRA